MCWAGTPKCPWVETQDVEGLSVPGNILVHVFVCWVRICHGMLCFWGILSVPVWAFGVLLTCIRLACLCPLEADHLVFFNIRAHSGCMFAFSEEMGLGGTFLVLLPQIPPPILSHLSLCLHQPVWPCCTLCKSLNLPSSYQFSVTDMKHIFFSFFQDEVWLSLSFPRRKCPSS